MRNKKTLVTSVLVLGTFTLLTGCGQNSSLSIKTTNSAAGSNTTPASNATANQSAPGSTNQTSSSTNQTGASSSQPGTGKTKLSVLYAGSMTKVMEQKIGPQVDTSLGVNFQGEGKGSTALAQMMKSGLRSPDVFVSASPSADKLLMGASNHDLVKWYMALAQDQLVIAYSPKSRFAKQLSDAGSGSTKWYQVMEEPGFRFGRTDPLLDPKGASTIFMFELAESYYHQPDLVKKVLKSNENPNQVFPEESLLSQLTTGQVDAIIAYKHEAVEWGVPYVSLPDAINLGNVGDASAYAKATLTEKDGTVKHAAPILFTITIPSNAKNIKGAEDFVQYMVSGPGHDTLMKDGFTPISADIAGNKSDVPSAIQNLISGTRK